MAPNFSKLVSKFRQLVARLRGLGRYTKIARADKGLMMQLVTTNEPMSLRWATGDVTSDAAIVRKAMVRLPWCFDYATEEVRSNMPHANCTAPLGEPWKVDHSIRPTQSQVSVSEVVCIARHHLGMITNIFFCFTVDIERVQRHRTKGRITPENKPEIVLPAWGNYINLLSFLSWFFFSQLHSGYIELVLRTLIWEMCFLGSVQRLGYVIIRMLISNNFLLPFDIVCTSSSIFKFKLYLPPGRWCTQNTLTTPQLKVGFQSVCSRRTKNTMGPIFWPNKAGCGVLSGLRFVACLCVCLCNSICYVCEENQSIALRSGPASSSRGLFMKVLINLSDG